MRRSPSFLALAVIGAALAGCSSHDDHRHRPGDHGHAVDASHRAHAAVTRATSHLVAIGNSGVQGLLTFEPAAGGVRVHGRITGLTPGEHGFHVHEFGDVSDTAKGESAGGHFDPHGMPHGHPTDDQRHAGDLGNVTADANGIAKVDVVDRLLKLDGPESIIGRSVVVHVGPDKFTQPVGDAGGRVAVGVIGIAGPRK